MLRKLRWLPLAEQQGPNIRAGSPGPAKLDSFVPIRYVQSSNELDGSGCVARDWLPLVRAVLTEPLSTWSVILQQISSALFGRWSVLSESPISLPSLLQLPTGHISHMALPSITWKPLPEACTQEGGNKSGVLSAVLYNCIKWWFIKDKKQTF